MHHETDTCDDDFVTCFAHTYNMTNSVIYYEMQCRRLVLSIIIFSVFFFFLLILKLSQTAAGAIQDVFRLQIVHFPPKK